MKKPSRYQSILWDMDLKSIPALNSTRDRHVQAAAAPAAAVVDGSEVGNLKSVAIKGNTPWCCLFLCRKYSKVQKFRVPGFKLAATSVAAVPVGRRQGYPTAIISSNRTILS